MIDSSLPVFDCSKPLLTGLSKVLADPDPGRKQELDILSPNHNIKRVSSLTQNMFITAKSHLFWTYTMFFTMAGSFCFDWLFSPRI